MSKRKQPAAEIEAEIVQVDLDGRLVNVLHLNMESVFSVAREGDPWAVAKALSAIRDALTSGRQLSAPESAFLVDGLTAVLGDLQQFGQPFGVVPKRGRPAGTGKITGWNLIRLGRLVDKAHHPDRYGFAFAPIPVEDNARGPGAYTLVSEGTGISLSIVKRAYTTFLRAFKR